MVLAQWESCLQLRGHRFEFRCSFEVAHANVEGKNRDKTCISEEVNNLWQACEVTNIIGLKPEGEHGFRTSRSTAANHINFTDDILSKLYDKSQVVVVYYDFKKAFDLD